MRTWQNRFVVSYLAFTGDVCSYILLYTVDCMHSCQFTSGLITQVSFPHKLESLIDKTILHAYSVQFIVDVHYKTESEKWTHPCGIPVCIWWFISLFDYSGLMMFLVGSIRVVPLSLIPLYSLKHELILYTIIYARNLLLCNFMRSITCEWNYSLSFLYRWNICKDSWSTEHLWICILAISRARVI